MAANSSSSSRASTELLIPKKRNGDREISPERTVIWTEPKSSSSKAEKRVPVIYYLSRNGQFEHPHFIQVPLSSPAQGLYLKDVMNRLNALRGEGMACLFSWSSKRSYKTGYVWQDLSENDLISPVNGRDYVLKGSELPPRPVSFRMHETTTSKTENSGEIHNFPAPVTEKRTRNRSWSSFENSQNEYRESYKSSSSRELAGKSTVAAEDRPRRGGRAAAAEVSRAELPSPPPSKIWQRWERTATPTPGVIRSGTVGCRTRVAHASDRTAENDVSSSGRMKASRVVMQLITCGSSTSVDSALTKSRSSSRAKF